MQIKFIAGGANSAFGGFSAGDIMRCSEEMAKHLVDDLGCAIYMDSPSVKSSPHDPEAPSVAVSRGEVPKLKLKMNR